MPRPYRGWCSAPARLYYDLAAAREERKANHVALVRLEQLYPFPEAEINAVLETYPASAEIAWVQEEPRNMGAWRFVADRMEALLDSTGRTLAYVGRNESASPATGVGAPAPTGTGRDRGERAGGGAAASVGNAGGGAAASVTL